MQNLKSNLLPRLGKYFIVPGWLLICFFTFTYHLGEVPPYHTDENYYVRSVKNMVDSGDYLTPVYQEQKRFAKPILFYWMMAGSYKMFGVNLPAARLWSSVFGTLSVLVLYLLTRHWLDPKAALLSALILPGFFLHFQIARWATPEMTMSFFILASFYFFVRGYLKEKNRAGNFYLFYLCMGLGFMVKGPPAILIPVLTIGLFLALTGQWKMIPQLRMVRGTLIVLIVVVPWFWTMYQMHGQEFTNHLLQAEVKERIIHSTGFSFYFFGVILRYYLPWSLFFVSAILVYSGLASFPGGKPAEVKRSYLLSLPGRIETRIRELRKNQQPVLFGLIWLVVTLLIFTLLRTQHSRYVLPASPAIAIILGSFFSQLTGSNQWRRSLLFKVPFLLTLIFYSVIAIASGAAVVVFYQGFHVPLRIAFLPFLAVFGVSFLILLFFFKKGQGLIKAMALTQILVLALICGDVLPFFNQYPMKNFSMEIRETGSGNERIALYRMGNNKPKLGILTAHFVVDYNRPEDIRNILETDEKVFVVMRESDWKEQFQDKALRLVAGDNRLKKIRLNKEVLREFWDQDVQTVLSRYSEKLVLLTNR